MTREQGLHLDKREQVTHQIRYIIVVIKKGINILAIARIALLKHLFILLLFNFPVLVLTTLY